jgi:hypothetical protein
VRGERRSKLDVPLTHIHRVRRETCSDDNGFGLVDVERITVEVGECQTDVERITAVCVSDDHAGVLSLGWRLTGESGGHARWRGLRFAVAGALGSRQMQQTETY